MKRYVLLAIILTTTNSFAAGWFGVGQGKEAEISFSVTPPNCSVYCSSLPLGKRNLGPAHKIEELKLSSGLHEFTFSLPGFDTVRKELQVSGKPVEVNVSLPPHSPSLAKGPLLLRVGGIFFSEKKQSALILYKGKLFDVDLGWVSPDGRFRIEAIFPDKILVDVLDNTPMKTFYF